MTSTVQILAIVVSILFVLLVLELVRRGKLTEEHSFIWLLCSLGLLALSVWRESLHVVARWLGVFYPPAVLLLVLFFFVCVVSLYVSLVISRQRQQIERLVEEVAILAAQQAELARTGPGPRDTPAPPPAAAASTVPDR